MSSLLAEVGKVKPGLQPSVYFASAEDRGDMTALQYYSKYAGHGKGLVTLQGALGMGESLPGNKGKEKKKWAVCKAVGPKVWELKPSILWIYTS